MALATEPPALPPHVQTRRRSIAVKLLSIAAIVAFLHVPLVMLHGVVRERRAYQAQATAEITKTWGKEQRIAGPVLAVPYVYRVPPTKTLSANGHVLQEEAKSVIGTAYFLPEDLRVEAVAEPEVRHRGIYDAVVYTSRLKFAGEFRPDFAAAGIEFERVHWERATVLFGASDLHGVRAVGPLAPGGAVFEPTEAPGSDRLGLAAKVSVAEPGRPISFAFESTIQGSGHLALTPVGKTSLVSLQSSWPHPSFVGAWLPTSYKPGTTGFAAEWKIAHFSRGFPQQWVSRTTAIADVLTKIDAAACGVRFAQTVDNYATVERAEKYGVLFFALVFAVYFLFETTAGLRIHPLQYTMVGAALCLFFLGFLALSEFWRTGAAYATAASACTVLVTLYSWSFLGAGWRTGVVGAGLGATYAYLFFVLRSEDYALLAGTTALFAVLALTMFCTRRINWFAEEQAHAPGVG